MNIVGLSGCGMSLGFRQQRASGNGFVVVDTNVGGEGIVCSPIRVVDVTKCDLSIIQFR